MSEKYDAGNMVKSVIAYKAQRERIKERQRKELEEELFAWKADVGDEILLARADGKSIASITATIGIQNRTFIYDMLGAANIRNQGKPVTTPATKKAPVSPVFNTENGDGDSDSDGDAPYLIEYYDGFARVTFSDGDTYEVGMIDGEDLDVPEEWGEHTKARRLMYKDIIKEIREHADSDT